MRLSAPSIHPQSAIALVATVLLVGLSSSAAVAQSGPAISGYRVNQSQTVLTIKGTDFGSQHASSSVTLDGSQATIQSWTNREIQVSLPSNTGAGTVTVATGGLATSIPFSGVATGYYTLSVNGRVTAHGNTKTYGDLHTEGVSGQSPAIQMVATTDGKGYWILTQNGHVYAFGDATNFGSVSQSITAVGMAVLPSGQGAYVLGQHGTVYPLGQAVSYGNAPHGTDAVSMVPTSDGQGYWILGQHGTTYHFGDAPSLGSVTPPTQSSASSLTNNSLVRVGSTSPIFLYRHGTVYHVPRSVLSAMGYHQSDVTSVPTLSGLTKGLPLVVPYPDGTLLQASGHNAVYLVKDGVLHWVKNAATFLGMGYKWSEIQRVSRIPSHWPQGSTMTHPVPYLPNGTVFRIGHRNAVYVVNNGHVDHVASASVFRAMGYTWSNVTSLPTMPSLPQGSAIKSPSTILTTGTLWRVGHGNAVYLYDNGTLRHIPSVRMFHDLGFRFSAVHNLSSTSHIPIGSALGSTTVPSPVRVKAVSLAATADNQGLWVLWQNGQVATVGDAKNFGQPSSTAIAGTTAVGLTLTPGGEGYTILGKDGTTFSYGDAQSTHTVTGAVSLAFDTAPSTSSAGFLSMAYGSFIPSYDGSYSTMVDHASALSVINPTWIYDVQNPVTNQWGLTNPPSGYQNVVSEAHRLGIQVWPQVGAVSTAPFKNATADQKTVSQLVSAVTNDNLDGVAIDFEPQHWGGMTTSEAAHAFDTFIALLAPALHQAGKKLMVNVYASGYPNTIYNYNVLARYADYLDIMDYSNHNHATGAGATSPLNWAQQQIQAAISGGLNPSKIIMGLAPYGHYWRYSNQSGMTGEGVVQDTWAKALLSANPSIVPVWDRQSGSEIFMTNQYPNSQGEWVTNPNATAHAPTPPSGGYTVSTDGTTSLKPVQNLQGLLNYILLRYAQDNGQSTPPFLSQDGVYGTNTEAAVALFQQDFGVSGDPSGTYGSNTEAALKQVIAKWNLGQYQYWIDTTKSEQERVQEVALADGVAGVDMWRVPFETSGYWTMLSQATHITHSGT